MLPINSSAHRVTHLQLGPLVNGLWQVASYQDRVEPEVAIQRMLDDFDASLSTWNLVDEEGPGLEWVGHFRRALIERWGAAAGQKLQLFVRWAPRPMVITRQQVTSNIEILCQRLGVECLDLVQLHWWDFQRPAYLDALEYLRELQTEGKIRHLGVANFDTAHLQKVLERGIPVVTNQVQFSLVDQRLVVNLLPLCQQRGVKLLVYGTLLGGLLSETYLGQPEPMPAQLPTVSLKKYLQIIQFWGGWGQFQQLLQTLRPIAQKHSVTIASVGLRAVLDTPGIASAIVGTRPGLSQHRQLPGQALALQLDADDRAQIATVPGNPRHLLQRLGDCGDEYRCSVGECEV